MATKASIDPAALERFRAAVARTTGLFIDESRFDLLFQALSERMAATSRSADDYVAWIGTRGARGELGLIAEILTVPETYFFRNMRQFAACRDVVFPELLQSRGERPIRVLSAGCASGEEPYSLAILVRDSFTGSEDRFSIVGLDLSPATLRRASAARYSEWSLRETPGDIRERWFRADGRVLALDDSVRKAVSFVECNLATDEPTVMGTASCDVIFCRNVLMYFTEQQCTLAMARLARALVPGGYLFLGHAESLRSPQSDIFELCHTHETFYYRRRPYARSSAPPPIVSAAVVASAQPVAIAELRERTTLALPLQAPPERPVPPPPTTRRNGPPSSSGLDLSAPLALLNEERYAEALALVRALSTDFRRDPALLLLEAVLLVHSGRFGEASATCLRLLTVDDLNAGAHYLLALCREGEGDNEGAMHHHHIAAYLDPTFAMPRVHLGLLSRRSGDLEGARKELVRARILLEDEDAMRISMFGGGFSRGALLELCDAEEGSAS